VSPFSSFCFFNLSRHFLVLFSDLRPRRESILRDFKDADRIVRYSRVHLFTSNSTSIFFSPYFRSITYPLPQTKLNPYRIPQLLSTGFRLCFSPAAFCFLIGKIFYMLKPVFPLLIFCTSRNLKKLVRLVPKPALLVISKRVQRCVGIIQPFPLFQRVAHKTSRRLLVSYSFLYCGVMTTSFYLLYMIVRKLHLPLPIKTGLGGGLESLLAAHLSDRLDFLSEDSRGEDPPPPHEEHLTRLARASHRCVFYGRVAGLIQP